MQSRVRNRRPFEIQFPQPPHPRQVYEAGIGDAGPLDLKVLKLAQSSETLQPGIRDRAQIEIQMPKASKLPYVLHASVTKLAVAPKDASTQAGVAL